MKPVLTILWIAALGQLALWTFLPETSPPLPVRDAAKLPVDDELQAYARSRQRGEALKALDQAWISWCSETGRARLIGSLGEYYYHRQSESERYPEIYGEPGAVFIASQWSSTEDQRIDRLTRQAYANGYLAVEEFGVAQGKDSTAARLIRAIVRHERVTGRGCAAAG